MGGKTSKSTQTVSIPPEVLARYNAVNARAEEAAGRPFQPYSYNPADFVAQLTPTQLAGIQNVNYAAGQAQPYFDEATGQLMGAQMAAVPYYAQAEQDIGYGQQMGLGYQQAAQQALYGAQAGAMPLNVRAGTAFEQAYAQGQPFIGGAVGQFAQGQAMAAPYQQAAGMNIVGAQDIGAQLAQQAYLQQARAGATAEPVNLAAYQDLARAYGSAQPLNQAAVQQYYAGLGAAQPIQEYSLGTLGRAGEIGEAVSGQALSDIERGLQFATPLQFQGLERADQILAGAQPYITGAAQSYQRGLGAAEPLQQYALQTLGRAGGAGETLNAQALQNLAAAGYRAEPLQQLAQGIYGQAYQAAQPYTQAALQQYYGGLGAAAPISQAALANLGAGQQIGQDITSMALSQLGRGQAQAMPIQQAALQAVGAAPYAAAPLTQAATANIAGAQATAAPYQQLAGELGLAAARPVSPEALTGAQIQQYISPYLSNVVSQTQALLNQQAQQAQSEQLGNAIRSGAFGGDRAGIAAANLAQQQQLAQGKVISDLLQSGYGQALSTAQQQQQLGLSAEQANRAAQQAAAGQLLGVGQAGFGQGIGAAQQQAALAQQLYGQQLGAGQAQAALAQQLFGQGATAAQQQQAAAQALFGQSAQAAQQQAALAQQLFGQQAAAGQNIAGLGQQVFAQGLGAGQAQQGLAQQLFGQGATTAQQQAAIAQALFGQGATSAAQQAALAQQGFGQNQAVAQGLAALGQQQFGQGMANVANQQAIAQALYGQGIGSAQQRAAIAQNLFGQGATQAAQQAAMAQQIFGQNQAVGQNVAQMAQQLYGQGTGTAQAQAAIGAQQFAQQMQQAQQQQALSQLLFGQGTTAAQQQAALGQQLFGQGITGGQALLGAGQQAFQQGMGLGAAQQGLGQQVFGQGLSASQQQAALGQQGFGQQLAAAQARQGLGQGLYGMGAGTAQQLAALGTGAQGAALTGAQAQLAAGQAQQQTAQAGLQALYNQFLQQQAYPFQAAQFLANVAMGTGALSGSTQTAITPGGLLSDVRMKENIREVGKTFDGQPVYSYNYKGDDKTQMGMLAQEVEQKHPEAVGLAGGMKTVDYDKATRHSARKPVTIDGEYTSSEGGPVLPHRAGEGFARGGYANGGSPGLAAPGDMAALLAAQAQMFGPFSGAGIPTGGMPGMPGYIPNATLPVSELVTPGPMPQAPDAVSQMQKIADIGKTGQEIYQKYKDKQTEKSATDAMNRRQSIPVITSSTRAAADGGAIMPYSGGTQALAIPTEQKEIKKLETPAMPQGRSAIDDVAAIAQTAAAVMAMMSDSRVKEDIKHIGHTHDGQKIYSYRYKGEPQTHIGLLAQEVEKKHPDAVGNIKGIKTVNYDMATEDAARKAVSLARGKAAGGAAGRAGYATDGTVEDEPSFAERMIPGIQTQAGVDANRRDIMRVVQERILDNPYLNPAAAMRRQQAAATSQPGLAAASQATPTVPAAPPAATPPAATTAQRRRGTGTTETSAASPVVDNRNVFPSSQFANLPESPMDGLTAAAAPPPAATGLAPTPAPSMPASLTGERDLGMAPMLGGTVKPRGVAPSTAKPSKAEVVAKDRSAPVESRMSAFLDWVKQPQNFIPLATGIAAATAAPTRDPFVALAQGLGAGAQAYQPVMQRQAELEKTRAETGKIGAETGVFEATTLEQLQQIANIRGLVPKEDPNGIFRVGDKRYSLVPVSQAIEKPSAGEARPTGAPEAPTTGVLGPNAVAAAQNAGTRFLIASEPEQTASRQQIDQSLAAGNKARNDLLDINRFAQSAALPRTPILEQGALFPIKNQLASFYDSLVTTFIQDPELQARMRIDPASMTQAQISDKVAFGTAALREAGAGQRSLGALEAFLAGSPNQTQTRETMVNLIADMIIHNQKLTDEAAAISDFDRLVESNTGLPRSFYYTDAVQAYQKDKPITVYENDRDQLVKIMMGDGYQALVNALKDPKIRPAMISSLDKAYGQGFHRYFTGSVM